MGYEPTPWVDVDGGRIRCDGAAVGYTPVVLDGFEITWGRDDYMAHSRPGTASFSVVDRSRTWADRISARTVLGREVTIGWSLDGQADQVCFRGRITAATAVPTDRPGQWVIDFTAAGRDADLGNILAAPATWPRETMITRANRIADMAVPAKIDEFYFFPGSVNIQCWPIDVGGRDLRSLTEEFYYSMGDTFSYIPDQNVCRHLFRRAYAVGIYFTHIAGDAIYLFPSSTAYDGVTYPGIALPGAVTTTDDPALSAGPNSVVTRCEVTWKDSTASFNDWTTVVDTAEGDLYGRRTLTFNSWIDDGVHIDPMIDEVLARAEHEGASPRHPPVTFDTRHTGGFLSVAQARGLTLAGETQAAAYVSGSRFAAYTPAHHPVFAIIGGTIAHVDGHWRITARLSTIWRTNAVTPMRWNQLVSWMWWRRTDDFKLARSITWNDFRYFDDPTVYNPA